MMRIKITNTQYFLWNTTLRSYSVRIRLTHCYTHILHRATVVARSSGVVGGVTVCAPLASCLLKAINNWFDDKFRNTDEQLAAVVHPKFKCDWIDNDFQCSQLTDILKRRASSLATRSADCHSASLVATSTEASAESTDFFAGLSARRQRDNGPLDVKHEVDNY